MPKRKQKRKSKRRIKNKKTIPLNLKSLGSDISKYPFVVVEWLDIEGDSGWSDTRALHKLKLPICVSKGYLASQKNGITRLFTDYVKTRDKEGYSALQIGFIKEKKPNNPKIGHFKKSNFTVCNNVINEFKCKEINNDFLGKEVTVESFSEGDIVSITGKSKGKGFAGHMKRYNFSGGRASHGMNSVMRKAGSIGAGTWPGRVWPGTKMAGRMGGDNVTIKNLKIVKIDNKNNLLFVKGAIPGSTQSIISIEKLNYNGI